MTMVKMILFRQRYGSSVWDFCNFSILFTWLRVMCVACCVRLFLVEVYIRLLRTNYALLTHIFSLSFLLPFPNKLKNNLVISHFNKQQMMKEQDQGLEMLGQSAERLSKISMGIHEELGHQNKWVDFSLCPTYIGFLYGAEFAWFGFYFIERWSLYCIAVCVGESLFILCVVKKHFLTPTYEYVLLTNHWN